MTIAVSLTIPSDDLDIETDYCGITSGSKVDFGDFGDLGRSIPHDFYKPNTNLITIESIEFD